MGRTKDHHDVRKVVVALLQHMTQKELAAKVGISCRQVARYACGEQWAGKGTSARLSDLLVGRAPPDVPAVGSPR